MKTKVQDNLVGYAFLAPALIAFLIFIGGPIVATFGLSFFDFNLVSDSAFLGLENYSRLFSDKITWTILGNTFLLTAVLVVMHLVMALVLSSLIYRERNRVLKYFYRTSIYFPSILTTAAVAVAWYFMFNYDYGVLNFLLGKLGITKIPWLTSSTWVVAAIATFSLWKFVGTYFLYYLIGLQNIPNGYYEAAEIDGANSVQTFFRITLPLLSPTIFFTMIITIIYTFQIFDEPYIITNGGPGNATRTMALYIYEKSFKSYEMGYSSAIATCLFVIIFIFTIIQFTGQKKWVVYDYE
jgi:multiple sugar transport system permease protein